MKTDKSKRDEAPATRDVDELTGYDFLERVLHLGEDVDDGEGGYQWDHSAYEETGNPWYLFHAIALVSTSQEDVPKWVSDALFTAAAKVADGVLMAEAFMAVTGEPVLRGRNGKRVFPTSMDEALGLTSPRGARPYYRTHHARDVQRQTFELVETIRDCYDVSVEQACQCVYYFRDVTGCVIAAEVVNEHKKRGLFESEADYERAYAKAMTENDKTFGEIFGASLDTLIDKYHREGKLFRERALARSARRARALKLKELTADDLRNIRMMRWIDELLGLREYGSDAWTIPEADARTFSMRPEFRTLAIKAGL